jgi:hypothetical protein
LFSETAAIRREKGDAMSDETESMRRALLQEMQTSGPASRESLEQAHGQVWDTRQMTEEFEVIGFLAPYVGVRRRADGRKGSLMFQHDPRLYYSFVEDD